MYFVDFYPGGSFHQVYFPTEKLARHFTWWAKDEFGKKCAIDMFYADRQGGTLSNIEEKYLVKFLRAEKWLQQEIAKKEVR